MPNSHHNHNQRGCLILAANSIGLAADIPARSLKALHESNLLVFEEDRPARQALKAAGLHRDYLRLNEHGQKDTLEAVKNALIHGQKVCYMSDQGMPTLADPGQELLAIAYQLGSQIEIIPGPSSISAALAACPFKIDQFLFRGFLSRDKSERNRDITQLTQEGRAVVLMEAPYRRSALLEALAQQMSHRKALLAVDISGPDECYYYDTLNQLKQLAALKLNFVLVLAPLVDKSGPSARRTFKKR